MLPIRTHATTTLCNKLSLLLERGVGCMVCRCAHLFCRALGFVEIRTVEVLMHYIQSIRPHYRPFKFADIPKSWDKAQFEPKESEVRCFLRGVLYARCAPLACVSWNVSILSPRAQAQAEFACNRVCKQRKLTRFQSWVQIRIGVSKSILTTSGSSRKIVRPLELRSFMSSARSQLR